MKAKYITQDNKPIFEGVDFYILHRNLDGSFTIKYWDSSVMESLKMNKLYLDSDNNKLKFSSKQAIKDYINFKELKSIVRNYNLIF